MKDIKIIVISAVFVLFLVWVGLPLLDVKPKATPSKQIQVIVDKYGNELYKIITRDE